MSQLFKFPLWAELSDPEKELIREWTSLTLRERRIKEALENLVARLEPDVDRAGNLDDGAFAIASSDDVNRAENLDDGAFTIVAFDDRQETAIPLESIAPRVTEFVMELKVDKSSCEDKCKNLKDAAKQKCEESC